MRDLWYKDAIVYSLDVETFQDGNGDGVGDFAGLTRRLEYLAGLGVTCLWLLPFYPTPNRDNGYDVTDYYNVDPRLGTLGDFVAFMHRARERGLRVIVDLPVNHTSDQHPWFEAARDPASPYRDFYVWSDERPEDADEGNVFPGEEDEIWTYDEQGGAYFLHRFYTHQPDLNIANPEVRLEICKIMGFWLELGISGFRVDAAPFLIELMGVEEQADVDSAYEYLREFRDFLSWRRGDAVLLGEANVAPEHLDAYFGHGTRLHMLFDFLLNQHLFLALARKEAAPIADGLRLPPPIPSSGQWAVFLRNHDELDLGRLPEEARHEVFDAFAPEPDMLLYERGIRRRLPPMFDGDQRRLRMAYSLMFSLPGTPVLRYGDEIGMGEDLSLDERDSVRTPMQWDNRPHAGFTDAPEGSRTRPVLDDGPYGYHRVNVDLQRRDPNSLLNWMDRLVRIRKECREIGWGDWEILDVGAPSVFAHACHWEGKTTLAVHNLSDEPCTVDLGLEAYDEGRLHMVFGGETREPSDGGPGRLDLEGYGFRWFRLDRR